MKILQLISSREGFYGAERMLVTLSTHLAALGGQVIVGAFDHSSGTPHLEVLEAASKGGLETLALVCRGRFDAQSIVALRRAIVDRGIDVVHTHGPKANLYAYLATRNTRARLVSTCHSWYFNSRLMRVMGAIDRVVLSRFDAVAVVSEPIRQHLRDGGVPQRRIVTIHNGIDPAVVRARGDGRLQPQARERGSVVGTVARLSREKGLRYLLDAAAAVLPDHPHVSFVVAGEGSERDALLDQARRLGIAGRVTFPGAQADMAGFYAGIDLFVLPSLTEGMPLALIEAMTAGKPVIATSVGSVPVLIDDQRNGVLVPPGDAAGLAAAMRSLLTDREFRARLGRSAHETAVARCSASGMAARYWDVYESLMIESPVYARSA